PAEISRTLVSETAVRLRFLRRPRAFDRPQMRWFDRASVKQPVGYVPNPMRQSRFGGLSHASTQFRWQRSRGAYHPVHQIRSNGQRYQRFFRFPAAHEALAQDLTWTSSSSLSSDRLNKL